MLSPVPPASDYVPQNLDATQWAALEPLYKGLIDRSIADAKSLQQLILDRSELDAAVSEAGSVLHINMTCHTEDAATNAAYLAFVEHVLPKLKEVSFELDKKIATHPTAAQLDQDRYGVLLRDLRLGVELFRPENIPLETELTKLEQEFQQAAGALTVQFRGEERTLPQMGKYQEETDRALREEAFKAVAVRRLVEREKFDDLYDRMLKLRHQTALNAGFKDYRDYMHRAKRRFDYTVADCNAFADSIERHVVPALRRINAQRAKAMGLDRLRPWDTAVDALGRPPLKPFTTADDMVCRTHKAFQRMDPSLGSLFGALKAGVGGEKCLDLESRKGKAPGGYQANRDRKRVPFIFMNATGVQRDVETMLHEAGHAFHALLCRVDPLLAYRSEIPLEFCEVASMSMELTGHPFLDEFYGKDEADRARRNHLEGVAGILPWIAIIDQFQHWVYTHPGHSRDERTAVWNDLLKRFYADVDWAGLEATRDSLWHRQLHLFTSPFYYIEYGIAQLAALQLWRNYRAVARQGDRAVQGWAPPRRQQAVAATLQRGRSRLRLLLPRRATHVEERRRGARNPPGLGRRTIATFRPPSGILFPDDHDHRLAEIVRTHHRRGWAVAARRAG
ncbi:MAG: M3 family oligoendopeptidase [Phycisphaerales bacterium]